MAADEDQILFGSNNALIADEFYDCIDAALVQGVASLPLMNKSHDDDDNDAATESRDQKMLRLLRASYTKYVDLMELYGYRNIFTVASRTAHFRKRIVETFHQGGPDDDDENNNENVENSSKETGDDSTKSTTDDAPPKLQMPTSANDIPSPEDMAALEDEIKTLRTKLKQARQQRVQEEKRCQELQEKADFAKDSNQTIDKLKNVETTVPAAVQAMVEGRANLEQSQREGTQLLEKMDNLQNNKRNNQDDDDEPDPDELLAQHMAKNASKQQRKKPKTLEDHYQEDREVLGETQVQDLVEIKQMLHRKA